MKVVILVTQLEGGGAQRASFRLSSEIRKRGIDCENWFLYKKRDNYSGLGLIRVCLHRPLASSFDYFKIAFRYYRLLKEHKPDVVITFTHYANVLGLFLAFLAGIKIRIASHRNPSWGDMSKLLMRIDSFFAEKDIYTAVTAVSRSTKNTFNYYSRRVFEGVKVINNGLDFTEVHINKDQARASFNLPAGRRIIGTIGRLSKQKNHTTLVKALSKLDDVSLAIVGDGELKHEIQLLITELKLSDRVFLLGEIKYDMIPMFLSTLDIFVMPSLFEGLSNALVEAMSVGVPIITSDVESQRDVVISENGEQNGVLLPAEDVDAWSKAIKTLFEQPGKLQELSKRSKIRASDFTVDKMADGFLDVINNQIYKLK